MSDQPAHGRRTLAVAGGDLAQHRRPRPRRAQPEADDPGRTARAARWRSASTPTTKRSRCATTTKARCGSARASTAPARRSRASARCWSAKRCRRRSSIPRSPPCCIPRRCARSPTTATRSASIPGSTRRNTTLPREAERDLTFRAARDAGADRRPRAGGDAHRELGFLGQHAGYHPRDEAAVRQLA